MQLLLLLHPFNGLFSNTTWVSQYQKGKTSLDLHEARDDGVCGRSGISWTICKQGAPHSRQTTTLITQFLQARCSFWRPTNSVKALKAIPNAAMQVIKGTLHCFINNDHGLYLNKRKLWYIKISHLSFPYELMAVNLRQYQTHVPSFLPVTGMTTKTIYNIINRSFQKLG